MAGGPLSQEDRVEFVRVDVEELRALGEALFLSAGMGPEHAATVVRVQLDADLTGMHSHGMRAVPTYLRRIEAGIIDPAARPRVVSDSGPAAVVDGDAGPGQVVAELAMATCIAKARAGGLAYVVARNSNHLGAVGYYARMAAGAGLVGFATTNGNVVMAPVGGVTPTVGNNPMAWAFPGGVEPLLALDVSTSVVAGGKIDLAADEGDPLPGGWGLDREGRPTTDATAAQAGLYPPLGSPEAPHKGFALALAMEVLAGALSGAGLGTEHPYDLADGPRPWNEGHFFLALDPGPVMPPATFRARVDTLVRQTRAAGPPGGPRPRAPGEGSHARRERALREGVPIPRSAHRALDALARERGLEERLR